MMQLSKLKGGSSMFDLFDLIEFSRVKQTRLLRNKWLFYTVIYAISCLSTFALRWEPFLATGLIGPVFFAVYHRITKPNPDSYGRVMLGSLLGAVCGLIVSLAAIAAYYGILQLFG